MDEYLQGFLNALSDNTAYDYIANHYTQFTKDELKDVILELLFPLVKDGTNLAMVDREKTRLGIKEELEGRWDYEEVEDDYTGNMPCDNSGFCAGASCSMYFAECHKTEAQAERNQQFLEAIVRNDTFGVYK